MTPTDTIPETPGTTAAEEASEINKPHPHGEAPEPDPADFFGDEEGGDGEPSLMGDEETAPEPGTEEPQPDEPQRDEPQRDEPAVEEPEPELEPEAESAEPIAPKASTGDATAGQTLIDKDGEGTAIVTEKGTTEPLEEEPSEQKTAEGGKGEPPADPATAHAKNGPRGYVVIREITLTKEYIDLFAKEQEEGKTPRKMYVVIEEKVEARNPNPVLMATFKKHAKRLGQPLRLGAIPLSMWKIRTLKLKEKVVTDNIEIED